VPFIHVTCSRLYAEPGKRSHAPDPENDLLLKAQFAIAPVQRPSDSAICGPVLRQVRVQQIKGQPAGNCPVLDPRRHPVPREGRREVGL
jgi:hypothetical protein